MKVQATRDQDFAPITLSFVLESEDEAAQLFAMHNITPICHATNAIDHLGIIHAIERAMNREPKGRREVMQRIIALLKKQD